MKIIHSVAFLAMGLAGLATSAHAGTREDVHAESMRCDGIADDRLWLDCYYGAAQPMRARLGLPPAPAAQTRLNAIPATPSRPVSQAAVPAALSPLPKDGLFSRVIGEVPDPHVSLMPMASYSFDTSRHLRVTLADGEIWVQGNDDVHLARLRNAAASYTVTILPGLLGNYDMRVTGVAGYFKVRRVH